MDVVLFDPFERIEVRTKHHVIFVGVWDDSQLRQAHPEEYDTVISCLAAKNSPNLREIVAGKGFPLRSAEPLAKSINEV